MLTDEQTALVEQISKKNGFENFSITVEQGSNKGDNYLGNIFLITVKENDENLKKCFILKCAESNEEVRKQMPIHDAYEREVFLYQTVLPTFEEFQKKYNMKYPFKAFIKLLGSSLEKNKEFLLMENIKDQGFKMLNRKKTMDEKHIALVMKELGKLHSVSLAMKQLEPDTYQHLIKNLDDYFMKNKNVMDSFRKSFGITFDIALKLVKDNPKATKAITEYKQEFHKTLEDLEDEKNRLVIVHGDAWCNNMMFKYEDPNNLSMCFLDWQISKIASPVSDLFYYFFSAASKPILDDHRIYLQLYYKTIQENLESVGCNAQAIFPFKLLQEHWEKFAKIGVFMSVGMLQAFLKDEKDAKSFVEMTEGGQNLMDQFWKDEEFSEEYCQRMRDIIFMMVENKYI
ncbi:unnamed protein product [Ceutorhynchus assimilis]|uniref:CHK kinase-like domain-containing protein n=1 Tax=Ceutorhynchus assimilis TaxID=467358 RepID=A0A9N9MXC7_9CUCU|nr:unnamed protein product [Ceutorhynchus assimilis]